MGLGWRDIRTRTGRRRIPIGVPDPLRHRQVTEGQAVLP